GSAPQVVVSGRSGPPPRVLDDLANGGACLGEPYGTPDRLRGVVCSQHELAAAGSRRFDKPPRQGGMPRRWGESGPHGTGHSPQGKEEDEQGSHHSSFDLSGSLSSGSSHGSKGLP